MKMDFIEQIFRIFDRFALQASMSLFLGKTLRLIEGQSDELSNEIMKTSYLTGTNPNLTSLSILSCQSNGIDSV